MENHTEHGHHHYAHGESEVTPQVSYVDGVITIELKENKSMLGLLNKPKVLIGFEQNFNEIKKLLKI